ncbi:hypothetical protein GFK26_18070 [Variovorax paradoxus]|uniref:Holliday junction nuclease RuvC n=1 Tax=Variovorax paradoxus TaxID=34073 RepID=A0A5Q0M515_VARPD|nr:hypothetical protein [Variovorax paradoxus]QFZ84536.1 hypothetical protein GFK26_18070 [Variovorax paradoxus]
MTVLRIMGIDPSLRNTGMCLGHVDITTGEIDWRGIAMVQTKPADKAKVQRQNSADLVSARELHRGVHKQFAEWRPNIITGEVPSGAQDARAALSFGMSIMLLASVPVPIIEVTPREVKIATGKKNATKAEIIEWAHQLAPHLPWLRATGKFRKPDKFDAAGNLISKGYELPAGRLMDDNEHMADSMASVAACVQTTQFMQMMAIYSAKAA